MSTCAQYAVSAPEEHLTKQLLEFQRHIHHKNR